MTDIPRTEPGYVVGDCARRFAVICGLMPPDEAGNDTASGCAVHPWGDWEDDPVGAVRECSTCGAVDWRLTEGES